MPRNLDILQHFDFLAFYSWLSRLISSLFYPCKLAAAACKWKVVLWRHSLISWWVNSKYMHTAGVFTDASTERTSRRPLSGRERCWRKRSPLPVSRPARQSVMGVRAGWQRCGCFACLAFSDSSVRLPLECCWCSKNVLVYSFYHFCFYCICFQDRSCLSEGNLV